MFQFGGASSFVWGAKPSVATGLHEHLSKQSMFFYFFRCLILTD